VPGQHKKLRHVPHAQGRNSQHARAIHRSSHPHRAGKCAVPQLIRAAHRSGDDERIYYANGTEDLSIVQILGVKNIGATDLRRVNDQRIPK
jgi:hypothetical protein